MELTNWLAIKIFYRAPFLEQHILQSYNFRDKAYIFHNVSTNHPIVLQVRKENTARGPFSHQKRVELRKVLKSVQQQPINLICIHHSTNS